MTEPRKRVAILHGANTPRGASHYLVVKISEFLTRMGIDVVPLHGTRHFEPADAIFVHVDLSVVPASIARFARRYPLQINASALDIRKSLFVDGLLDGRAPYPAPVIVKSNLNYGGVPEQSNRSLPERAARRLQHLLKVAPAPLISAKSDYRIFADLADVPREYFNADTVVQKLCLEKDAGQNLLREYIFLGDQHFQNIERSSSAIITDGEHIGCLPFTPHPHLLNVRRRLKLDYGKIDFVMIDGEPFVFDANKTLGTGETEPNQPYLEDFEAMLMAFAEEIRRMLSGQRPQNAPSTEGRAGGAEMKTPLAQFPHAARSVAKA